MKSFIWSIVIALVLSFIFTSAWFILFGFNQFKTLAENLISLATNQYFWSGVGIWTVLFALFITLPIAFLRHKPNAV